MKCNATCSFISVAPFQKTLRILILVSTNVEKPAVHGLLKISAHVNKLVSATSHFCRNFEITIMICTKNELKVCQNWKLTPVTSGNVDVWKCVSQH